MKNLFPRTGVARAGASRPNGRNGSDEHLRGQARRLIQAGVLPGRRPDRIWGGPGAGAPCAVCEHLVSEDEVEMELEFTREDDPDPVTFHVHLGCFAALERERRRLESAPGTKETPQSGQPGAGHPANGAVSSDGS